jgi:hypothetical protein
MFVMKFKENVASFCLWWRMFETLSQPKQIRALAELHVVNRPGLWWRYNKGAESRFLHRYKFPKEETKRNHHL